MPFPLPFAENHTHLCSERGDQVNSLSSYRIVGTTWRPVKGDEIISLPSAETKTGLEFHHKTIQAFGVVLTRAGQLVLLPANGLDQKLPDGSELVGTIPAPKGTHVLRVHDRVMDEDIFTLGIIFPNTVQPDWVQLALDRREKVLAELAEERREREAERIAELDAERLAAKRAADRAAAPPWYETSRTWRTNDTEVIRRIAQANGLIQTRTHNLFDDTDEIVATVVEDPNGNGAAIEAEVERIRAEHGADADAHFKRERERAYEVSRSRASA
jgi:hypothetical protein